MGLVLGLGLGLGRVLIRGHVRDRSGDGSGVSQTGSSAGVAGSEPESRRGSQGSDRVGASGFGDRRHVAGPQLPSFRQTLRLGL